MVIVDMMQTGKNIRQLQKVNHTNGRMLADICGVTQAAVCKWGKDCMPSIDALVSMANIWNVKVDDIIATKVI